MPYGIDHITTTPSGSWEANSQQSIDNIRRTFGISDKVAQLAPQESIFLSYLSKLGKKPTDDTVWKPLEYRNQWQRRNFTALYQAADGTVAAGVKITVDYNNQGKVHATETYSPIYLVAGQVLRINGVAWRIVEDATILYGETETGDNDTLATDAKGTVATQYALIETADLYRASSNVADYAVNGDDDGDGQVIGSQWSEGSGAPEGWRDELSAVEFFTQIFKTSVPLMSGSAMATRYRGFSNEFKRIYAEHVKAHKMDLENAFLFGYGKYTNANVRTSWGIEPFIRAKGGKKYELDFDGTVPAGSGYDLNLPFSYDGIIDLMDDFMNWEGGNSGQKLCLTSRKVINALHKVGANTFLKNSFDQDSSQLFNASLDVKTSSFMPIDITSIKTSWGSMNFTAHPLFRGDMANTAVCVDLANVSLRPLSANGTSRDTFVETNIQANDVDGRKDQIITEAGLEIMLPETHAVIDFVTGG